MDSDMVTAVAAFIAAIGGIVAAFLAYLGKRTTDKSKAEIILTKKGVFELGKQVDGRLSQLLEETRKASRAEGVAAGEQSQRDRAAEPQP